MKADQISFTLAPDQLVALIDEVPSAFEALCCLLAFHRTVDGDLLGR